MDTPGPFPLRRPARPVLRPAIADPKLVSHRTAGPGGAGGDGAFMPAPFSPDSPDDPTAPLPAAKAPSTHTNNQPPHDPEAHTPLAAPTPSHYEPPTII